MSLFQILFVTCFKSLLAIKPEVELVRYLKNTSYDASVPPNSLPVLVSVQIGLYVLNEVDTRSQSFKVKFSIRLLWRDGRISFPPVISIKFYVKI